MSDWNQYDALMVFEQIMERATTEMDFRQLVTKNPCVAIKEISGKDLPIGYRIKVIEKGAHSVMEVDTHYNEILVLPEFQGHMSGKTVELVA